MNAIVENILMHYGVARRSGRYPWGSGENPYQHSGDFLSRVQELKNSGLSETDIAKSMGLTTTQLRTQMSLAKDERRSLQVATAKDLRAKGYSLNDIAKQMGFSNDSSVRSLLNEGSVTGKRQSLSLINKRAEEGDWGEWSKTLPAQFLSKQNKALIDKQLGLAKADKQSEFDEICSLTNPTVKKVLLKSFAEDCDAAAVHLQAAALPRQKYQVILPLTSIKDF